MNDVILLSLSSNIPATAQAHMAPKLGTTTVINKSKFGSTDVCPRCGKAVYMAEKMMGGGSVSFQQHLSYIWS